MWISAQVRKFSRRYPPVRQVRWGHEVRVELREEMRRFWALVDN